MIQPSQQDPRVRENAFRQAVRLARFRGALFFPSLKFEKKMILNNFLNLTIMSALAVKIVLVLGVIVAIIRVLISNYNKIQTPVFYINLERRKDRKKHCISELSPHFRNLKRFTAVDGKSVDSLADSRISLFYDTEDNRRWDQSITWMRSHKMTHGEIGCGLSHRGLWELAAKKKMRLTLIFEDDVVLHDNFRKVFADINIPTDCDILYLGYIDPGGLGEFVDSVLRRVIFLFGAYAYILTASGLKKLMPLLPIDRPVDNFLGHLTETKQLNGYAVYPPIADQIEYGGYGSDIVHSAHL